MRRTVIAALIAVLTAALVVGMSAGLVYAQGPASPQVALGDVAVSGSLRTRTYSWNWFGESANGDYVYPGSLARVGLSESKRAYEWQVELAVPFVLRLPSTAVVPGPPGQLGLGATYFAANSGKSSTAAVFIKQGTVRFARLGGLQGQSLKVGRMEFNDGSEVAPKNPTLAALKRDRISQRLLGNFGFSDVGRSIDGALYSVNHSKLNVTVLGGRPTQGVFQVDGWGELNVNLFYGALTRQIGEETNSGEWRVFGLSYRDYRNEVLKIDSRPLAARRADAGPIHIATYGGHYLGIAQTAKGPIDLLAWAALQSGSWGALDHRAGAFAAEAGWQPEGLETLRPWIRGGYNYGSGTHDPTSRKHGTFFQVLPTPRVYARVPFFNMMNSEDGFGELILRPARRLTIRTDMHGLRLADPNDLWYSGGGAFQPATFGYTGRPSSGQSGLATLYDASGDYILNAHTAIGGYYGYAIGRSVTQAIYASGNLHFSYLELLFRF